MINYRFYLYLKANIAKRWLNTKNVDNFLILTFENKSIRQ